MTATRATAAALALASTLAAGGCATSWLASQAAGNQRIWDEQVREAAVPLPGIDERLTVTMPLVVEYREPTPARDATPAAAAPPAPGRALPFALACSAEQQARDRVYHSAFRYGRRWKRATAIMFLVEAAAASAVLLIGDRSASDYAAGGYLAADALGTALLFFAPRKEIYRHDETPVVTRFRDDCPAGLELAVGDDRFTVDAAGRVGEVGELALDDWMQAPRGAVRVHYAGHAVDLVLGIAERCVWNRQRGRPADAACAGAAAVPPRQASAVVAVAPGTLTRVAD